MKNPGQYHIPVLLQACLEGLGVELGGVFVDLTYGGGGHSKEIIKFPNVKKLIAFDQDSDAFNNKIEHHNFIFVPQNFRFLRNFLEYLGYPKVNGILADLGISSHHIDVPERGFSYRYNGPLDMRMNTHSDLSASLVINDYSDEELYFIFKEYGEVKNPGCLVKSITTGRKNKALTTVDEFLKAIATCIPKKLEHKYLAKVFQAIRIEVNQELEVLKEMLEQSVDVLDTGGRLVVISYNSLEDKLVKNFIKQGKFRGQAEKDVYGNVNTPLREVNRKVIIPDEEEIARNNRARSAKLRVAEKK